MDLPGMQPAPGGFLMIDIPEDAMKCGMCGAILWIATPPDGKHHLMRLATTETHECRLCTDITESVKDE